MIDRKRSIKIWKISENKLNSLTPLGLRDLIVECFFYAQKETIQLVRKKLNQQADDESIRKSVSNMVKLTFRRCNEDFDNPSKEGICKVVNELAKMSKSWGTPEQIIEHHKTQILNACKYL